MRTAGSRSGTNETDTQGVLAINENINQKIAPDTDQRIYGVPELWVYPRTVGDCEDYVLLKRQTLIEQGFSASNLLITVVLQPNGEGHAVLTVRTDYGDYILDNMRSDVRLWSETGRKMDQARTWLSHQGRFGQFDQVTRLAVITSRQSSASDGTTTLSSR